MRPYFAHNMDGNENLLASLETTKSEAIVAQKLVKEEIGLLRKTEEENETVQTEARQLVEKKETMVVDKKKKRLKKRLPS